MWSGQAERTALMEVIDNSHVLPLKNGRCTSLEGIRGLDSAGEPDVDEDGVSTGRNCDDRTSVILAMSSVLCIRSSMP